MSQEPPTSDGSTDTTNGAGGATGASGVDATDGATGPGGVEAGSAASAATGSRSFEPYETHPTIRPTLAWLGIVIVVGAAAAAVVVRYPDVVGGPDPANVVANAIVLLTAIGVVRFLVRVYVLSQTVYRLDDDVVRREYSLLLRSFAREVPFSKVRSHEARQGRVQRLFGYGTVALNQGLGDVELENVPSPHDVHDRVRRRVEAATDD